MQLENGDNRDGTSDITMTNFRRCRGSVILTILLSGCTPHSISGTYVARGQQFVDLLQITQSPNGQLLGSLNRVSINSDGAIEQVTVNISGTTDGHSLTLVGKAAELLSISINVSGTINGNSITIIQPNGIERFVSSTPRIYQSDVQQLEVNGNAIRQGNVMYKCTDKNGSYVYTNIRHKDCVIDFYYRPKKQR